MTVWTILFFLFAAAPAVADSDSTHMFPHAWEGNWAGDLHIFLPGQPERSIPMALDIQSKVPGRWAWTLIYMPGEEEDRRAYTLEAVDPTQGLWEVDEHNGIVLESRYLGGSLLSRFAVGEQLLLARYQLLGEQLLFEIIAGPAEKQPANTTETGPDANPAVYNLPVGVYQQAVLIRR
jgi:hypothetical protein